MLTLCTSPRARKSWIRGPRGIQTRTTRGPRPSRGLADCFHAATCCCACSPLKGPERYSASSRSHSSSVKGRALAPGQDQQGSVFSLRSPPLRQKVGALKVLYGFRPRTMGEPDGAGMDGEGDLEHCLQSVGQGCLPEDVAMLSLCVCPLIGAVAILTHLVVAAGSEIVFGWEGVMSISPLSDTFPGNLAGSARLGGLSRGEVRWSRGQVVGSPGTRP